MSPRTFTQRAGRKKNNGLFAYFRRGRMLMGRRHAPMQATARRRFLRQSLDQLRVKPRPSGRGRIARTA